MSSLPIEVMLAVSALSGSVLSESIRKLFTKLSTPKNKLSADGYDLLEPKKKIEKLPESARFTQKPRGYRDQGYEPMRCHRCGRACIYCKRLEKLKRSR